MPALLHLLLNLSNRAVATLITVSREIEEDKKHREAGTGPYSPEALSDQRQRDEKRWASEKEVQEKRELEKAREGVIERRRYTCAPLVYWTFRCIPRSETNYHAGKHGHETVAQVLGVCEAYRKLIDAPLGNGREVGETYESLRHTYVQFFGGPHAQIHLPDRSCEAQDLTEEEAYMLLNQEICNRLGRDQFESAKKTGEAYVTEKSQKIKEVLNTCNERDRQIRIQEAIGFPV